MTRSIQPPKYPAIAPKKTPNTNDIKTATNLIEIQILEPTHLIAISARPEEIYNRRMKDDTRNRDKVSIEGIKKELAVQDAMLASCSVLSGSPLKVILNNEGKIDEAAQNVIDAIGVGA